LILELVKDMLEEEERRGGLEGKPGRREQRTKEENLKLEK
jgi:hypothetical protein